MVVLLGLSNSRVERLGYRIRYGRQFTVTIPERRVKAHRRWRLCLLIADSEELWWNDDDLLVLPGSGPGRPAVIGVARLRGSGRPTTTDERIAVAAPSLVEPPLPMEDLMARLADADQVSHQYMTEYAAIELEGARGQAVIQSLLAERPDLADVIDRLSRFQEDPIEGEVGKILALERDAAQLALAIARFDLDTARNWDAQAEGGYLDRLAYSPREEILLGYDASRFPDWRPVAGGRPDWRRFTDGRHHLRIASVNATPLERVLGVDLIYRHVENDTFVLVQYKRLKKRGSDDWVYRPDGQLDKELKRMRNVDAHQVDSSSDPATWRLYPHGCFVKLVKPPERFDPTSDRLLSGIYLPAPYLELMDDAAKKATGHRRALGFRTVDRYLTTGMFVALVREGWIGTHGVTTRAIEAVVESAVGEQRSVVVAEEAGEQPGQERRGRPMRGPSA